MFIQIIIEVANEQYGKIKEERSVKLASLDNNIPSALTSKIEEAAGELFDSAMESYGVRIEEAEQKKRAKSEQNGKNEQSEQA